MEITMLVLFAPFYVIVLIFLYYNLWETQSALLQMRASGLASLDSYFHHALLPLIHEVNVWQLFIAN